LSGERRSIEVDGDDLDRIAPQIPRAETLPAGTRLVVFGGKSRGWLGKLLPPRGAPPAGVIGSALLARGYVNIGSSDDAGRTAVWGESGESDETGRSAS
jgi:hypothetical protein